MVYRILGGGAVERGALDTVLAGAGFGAQFGLVIGLVLAAAASVAAAAADR